MMVIAHAHTYTITHGDKNVHAISPGCHVVRERRHRVNMKCNKESREEGKRGDLNRRRQPGQQPLLWCQPQPHCRRAGSLVLALYFTMVSALPALPRRGAGGGGQSAAGEDMEQT